jgi:uncharacterized protein YhaN
MRIERLTVQRFGALVERSFELRPGFVLFSGKNEAGKSTALRALSGLLFGIPPKSADAWGSGELRVGARVVAASGALLEFVRRKGQKNTLLDPAGTPLPEEALRPFLGTATRDVFESTFGLDHVSLGQGGAKLLASQGALGAALFDAASSRRSVRALTESLRAQADEIYKPRGQKLSLNVALDAYKKAEDEIRRQSVSAEAWASQRVRREELSAKLAALTAEREQLDQQRHALACIGRARPKALTRRRLLAELRELGFATRAELPPVSAETRARREALVREQEDAEREVRRLERSLADVDAELGALMLAAPVPGEGRGEGEASRASAHEELALLGEERISALRRRFGAVLTAEEAIPLRTRELEAAVADHAAARRRLESEFSDARGLSRLASNTLLRDELRASVEEHAEVSAELARRSSELAEAQARLSGVTERLARRAEVPSSILLEAALARSRSEGDVEARLREAEQARVRGCELVTRCETELRARLADAPSELGGLALPSEAYVERARLRQSALADELGELERVITSCERELAEFDLQRRELEARGAVPSEAELSRARAERDALWAELRRSLERQGSAPPDPAAFELAARRADEIVDRLRSEAERVAQRDALLAASNKAELRRVHAVRAAERLRAERAQLMETWASEWNRAGIKPLAPESMLDWLRRYSEYSVALERRADAEVRAKAVTEQRSALKSELLSAFEASGAPPLARDVSLAVLVTAAEARVQELARARLEQERAEHERVVAQDELARRAASVAEAEARLATWRVTWQRRSSAAELIPGMTPDRARRVLDGVKELLELDTNAARLQRDTAALNELVDRFAAEVTELVQRHAPGLEGGGSVELAERLTQLADDARKRRERRLELAERLATLQGELARERARAEGAEVALRRLLAEVGAADVPALISLEGRVERARHLWREVSSCESDLEREAVGGDIEALVVEVEGWEPARLFSRQEELESELQRVIAERDDVQREQVKVELGMSTLESGAAHAAELAQSSAAVIRSELEKWVALRFAEAVLGRELERYRAAHQGPLLARASELYRRLTLGSFERLLADYGKGDDIVLRCERADGSRLDLDALSTGSRDQLYLALRLATVEHWVQRAEPLPMVLDDVLVHFDDERARAALRVLVEVAEKTQVLFFTHHRRIEELAADAIPEAQLTRLSLDA